MKRGDLITEADYTLVVPSHRRTHNMPTILRLLPTALICVDEREREAYGKVVPAERLLLHPPTRGGLPPVMNWMLHAVKTPILIEVDDDFVGVQVLVGSNRFITDPAAILVILENAAQACHDLGLGVFCFLRTQNPLANRPEHKPILPMGPVCAALGVMNAARHRLYDTELLGRADMDFVLRTLRDDRAVYQDTRFYFDCGRVFSGRGGNVGQIDDAQFKRATALLKERWGKYVDHQTMRTGLDKLKQRGVARMRMVISRTNPAATR